jgi:YYY domain-containing protein
MMIDILLWYLVVSLIGWLTFPLASTVLRWLPDRGYVFSRSLGLLLWGFLFWLLTSLQVTQNDLGGEILTLSIIVVFSAIIVARSGVQSLKEWLCAHRWTVLTVEALFLVTFIAWAMVRSMYPEIIGTEKPMDFAFINAIWRSPSFPPSDPWLSGYSISYYYFGYVLVAMLMRITGTPNGMAFNLAVAMWFSLTAVGAYGVMFNLLASRKDDADNKQEGQISVKAARLWALLGSLFILVISNLEGFLEMLHARGIFWTKNNDGSFESPFWSWLNIQEISQPPTQPFSWMPERVSGIWWWRASRVLQDFNMANHSREIIDEFPFFSYLLADLHPHVLAMPFVLLAIALALNLYFKGGYKAVGYTVIEGVNRWVKGESVTARNLRIFDYASKLDFWLAGIVLGSIGFFNTWDLPIYVGLYCAVDVLYSYRQNGWSWVRVWEFAELGLLLIGSGIFLYLPFYISFSSQAGGILPSLSFFTRGVHFWVMFAPLLAPIFIWMIWGWRTKRFRFLPLPALRFSVGVVAGLWIFSYLFSALITVLPQLGGGNISEFSNWRQLFYDLHGSSDAATLLVGSLGRRLLAPGTWISLLFLVFLSWGFLAGFRVPENTQKEQEVIDPPRGIYFVLLMILVGAGLALVPEFVYLRDQFGWRMNTIFKFYFQVWMLWGLAAATGIAYLWVGIKSHWKWFFRTALLVLIAMALAYPVNNILDKFRGASFETLTLDGTAHIGRFNEAELEAIEWLQDAPYGGLVEAVGGSYSGYGRISASTGMPSLLGWPGHESQWRGGAEEMGSRESDIERLYQTRNWEETLELIEKYDVRYIFIGSLEQSKYRVHEVKFENRLKKVFSRDGVIIYEVPQYESPELDS